MIMVRHGWGEQRASGYLVRRPQEDLKVRALCEQLLHQYDAHPKAGLKSLDRMQL